MIVASPRVRKNLCRVKTVFERSAGDQNDHFEIISTILQGAAQAIEQEMPDPSRDFPASCPPRDLPATVPEKSPFVPLPEVGQMDQESHKTELDSIFYFPISYFSFL